LWAANRRSVIFVTHDLSEAILLADRILMMSNGRIVDEAVVNVPRPRNAETIVQDPEYLKLHQRLIATLHSTPSPTTRTET
jgi:NitT/TauT family transport system ATP-binding protein